MQEMQTDDADVVLALAVDAQGRVDAADRARDVAVRHRRPHILALHRLGWGYRRIAEAVGISHTSVWKIVEADR